MFGKWTMCIYYPETKTLIKKNNYVLLHIFGQFWPTVIFSCQNTCSDSVFERVQENGFICTYVYFWGEDN